MTMKTPAQLLARMGDLELQTPVKTLMSLFYGPSGAGKTTFAVALAQRLTQTGKIIYLDSSDGWVSLQNFEGLTTGVTRLQINNYDDMMGMANALEKKAKGFEEFDVIVIDEGSTMAEEVLDEVVVGEHGSIEADVEGKDYRPMQRLVMTVFNKLHKIEGLHVIIVAHDRQDIDHRKVSITSPGFSPKLGKAVMKLMHIVGHVTATVRGAGNNTTYEHIIQCQPTMLVQAKSRAGGMPLSQTVMDAVERIAEWVEGGTMAVELTQPEENVEPVEDELPTDGIPAQDVTELEDDEPALIESGK